MIRHLLLLNGLAVIAAVVQHASGWGFTSLFWWTDRYRSVVAPDFSQLGGVSYYSLRVLEQISIFAPPAFLFVSGFFVIFATGRGDGGLSWQSIQSRLRMLLIPYLLWSTAIFMGRGVEGESDTSLGYLQQLLVGQAAEPYYYIPLLTQLYLLSPLLVLWVKRQWKVALVAAAILQVAVQAARYPVMLGLDVPTAQWVETWTPGWLFPNVCFWFVLGLVTGFQLQGVRSWLDRWRSVLPAITALAGIAALVEWELLLTSSGRAWLAPAPTVLDSVFSGGIILTFLSRAAQIPTSRWLDGLGERSFGVYLIHAPVIELASRATYHIAPLLLAHQFMFQTLLIVAGLGIPLLVMWAVNRSRIRPYYNYLFG